MRTHVLLGLLVVLPLPAQGDPPSIRVAERSTAEVVDAAAVALGWNILYSRWEIDQTKAAAGVPGGADTLRLPETEAEQVLSRWLFDRGFALVPLARDPHLFLIVSRNGPRGDMPLLRATSLSPGEVLTWRESRSYVVTTVSLQAAEARPIVAAVRGTGTAVVPVTHRQALIVFGPADDVAAAVERARALDLDSGAERPDAASIPGPDALAREVDAIEQRVIALEQRAATGAAARRLVLDAGEYGVEELLRAARVQLEWPVFAQPAELESLRSVGPLRLQSKLVLAPNAARRVWSQLLFAMGFAVKPLDRDRDLHEIVAMHGPRGYDVDLRAELRAPEQVLASRGAAVRVTTVLHLRHTKAKHAVIGLRPVFSERAGGRRVGLAAIGDGSVMVVRGLAPTVAMVIDLVAEFDRPARGSEAATPPGVAMRIAGLQWRVEALEAGASEDAVGQDGAAGFTLSAGELSLKSLFAAAERATGVRFRAAQAEPPASLDEQIALPRALRVSTGEVVPLVTGLTAAFGRVLMRDWKSGGYALLPRYGRTAAAIADAAEEKTVAELLALRDVPVPVRALVELSRLQSSVVVNALRPLFQHGSAPQFSTERHGSYVFVTALAPQAAAAVALLSECDRDPGAGAGIDGTRRVMVDLRARLARLQ